MQYNSETNNQDIVSEIRQICGVDSNGYSIEAITRRVNEALYRYCVLAFQADGRWPFDDIGETSPPIDTQDLVSGTNRYKFDDFTEKIINLIKLEALDSNGNGIELKPETFDQIGQRAPIGTVSSTFEELYIQAQSGAPTHYCKYGDFIYLRPKPNYNKTNGLVAYFNRPATTFSTSDTTVTPGIPVIHHYYLCRYAAYPKLVELQKFNEADRVRQEIKQDEKSIIEHFSRRDKEVRDIFKPKQRSFR